MTHRFAGPAAAVFAALSVAAPAHAITKGTPDGVRHPYVGALVSYDPESGDKYLICSGTLVSRTVFLTAAHCLEDEPSDLYVSFDATVGAPDVGPAVELHHGQAYGDPAFTGDTTGPGDTHDLAVVVLDAPVRGVTPARLAERNQLNRLRKRATTLRWTVVGYGREGYDSAGDAFFGGGSKRTATSSWQALRPGTFVLSQDEPGEGGTCNGDSGGPVLIGDSRTVAGISSDGDPKCQVDGIYSRVDTRAAKAFLGPFLRGQVPPRAAPPAGKPEKDPGKP